MKKIACFCIPAHGHTNPMLPVIAELVKRGNIVRFYSFDEFSEKIKATGATFISVDRFLPELSEGEMERLKSISTTEMTIQAIRTTCGMNDFLDEQFKDFQPDVVYTDSVCFWGKLAAWKYHVPMVVSTSTFAFNQMSSQYMKYSLSEMTDMIFGLPKISKELKTLKPYGYHVKNALALVQSDNETDSVVYTTERFQPYAESFSDHYLFAGPSVFSKAKPAKDTKRPLIYIAMGTIINDRPDLYEKCISALKSLTVDVVISCGRMFDQSSLGKLPDNISIYPYVDQLELLSKASVFITHCGMNSVSESLYMATPMVLYPQTGEQQAVARRVTEMGAGILLTDDGIDGIRTAVEEILRNKNYVKAAEVCSSDFSSSSGVVGAAEFIENAPHTSDGVDIFKELNAANGKFQICYWLIVCVVMFLFGMFVRDWTKVWIIGVLAGILAYPIGNVRQKKYYDKLIERYNK